MTRFFKLAVCFLFGMVANILLVLAVSSPGHTTVGEQTATLSLTIGAPTDIETTQPLTGENGGQPLPPAAPSTAADPAEGVAPPGLDIQPGDAPITPFMAIAMRQELGNLVGRFESALFLVNAADQPPEVRLNSKADQADQRQFLVATADNSSLATAIDAGVQPVLIEARQLIQDWSGLIEQRAYREARDRWLTVRQTLWDNFPTDRAFAQPEIRSMWLDRGSIVRAGSPERLAILFDRMQAAGINTVFLETINASYPIYPSQVAPLQNPLTRRWDPLAAAVELAHERHMELHAWMWVFAAGNQRHNAILNLPTDYLGPVLNAHPDWAAYDNDGSPIPRGQTKPFFDPANPEVRAYLLKLVDEIISTYDIDGLQLDYIRYPFQDPGAERTYGYGLAARERFQQQTGVDPLELTPRVDPWLSASERAHQLSLWEQWTDFRIQQVTSFVEETAALVRRQRPDIILSTAVFALPEHERLQKIQQDWNTWAQQGVVDWVILMSYAQDANRFEKLIKPWISGVDYSPTLVIPGIRLLNLSVAAMIDQLQTLRDLPAPGYALFATNNLDTSIQTVLHQTQGNHDTWIPHQAPYQTAAKRFQGLQQEWNWLLASGQLSLDSRLADGWIAQINALGQDLTKLADGSSSVDVAMLQSRVQDVKDTFGVGMRLQTATNQDYRFRAWENRLESIRRFLTYGAVQRG